MNHMVLNKAKVTNYWDILSDRFNTHKDDDEIHPDAAVNIFVGWPTILQQIHFHKDELGVKSCKILDFGCGAGGFCRTLHKLGHEVIGLDRSPGMVEVARKSLKGTVKVFNGEDFHASLKEIKKKGTFDIITSIHSLEWNEDLVDVFDGLIPLLKNGGILVFAVFPKSHIVDSLKIHDLFEDFDSKKNPKKGFANFDGVRVPVYIRDTTDFDKILTKMGMERFLEFYPAYPKHFLVNYNWTASMEPEMLILAYRKK